MFWPWSVKSLVNTMKALQLWKRLGAFGKAVAIGVCQLGFISRRGATDVLTWTSQGNTQSPPPGTLQMLLL